MYINNLTYEKLTEIIVSNNFPKFRAEQIFRWIHLNMVNDYSEMSNLSKEITHFMNEKFSYDKLKIFKKFESKEDETKKYLFELEDGNIIETVYMKYSFGESICISSQVGCNMGCLFCASTKGGKVRNLRTSEMLEQIYMIQKDLNTKINSIVIMGSGEPFDNFENVENFINIITNAKGMNISKRKITISTCGITEKIYEAADRNLLFNLAVSLHASNQSQRDSLIPISKKYNIADLIKACDYFTDKTGRRVTYEYILIKDFNDKIEDANNLVSLLRKSNCLVNLIPLNPIKEFEGESPSYKNIIEFQKILNEHNINATIRRELGRDIDAACGQLRRNYI